MGRWCEHNHEYVQALVNQDPGQCSKQNKIEHLRTALFWPKLKIWLWVDVQFHLWCWNWRSHSWRPLSMPLAIAETTRGCFIQKFVCSGVKSWNILHTISALKVGNGLLTLQEKKRKNIRGCMFLKLLNLGTDIQYAWRCIYSSIQNDERDNE